MNWRDVRVWWRRRRHHILDLRDTGYGYDGGWCDRDALMLIACFRLLCDYVEQERPFERVDWDWDDEVRRAASEIKDLYDWWKVRRSAAYTAHGAEATALWGPASWRDVTSDDLKKQHFAREDELRATDNANLLRLIAIREFLWT